MAGHRQRAFSAWENQPIRGITCLTGTRPENEIGVLGRSPGFVGSSSVLLLIDEEFAGTGKVLIYGRTNS
jgi:hypothetical protein